MKTITITFNYNEGEEWKEFWNNYISKNISCANPDGNIQVSTWYVDRDCVSDLKELEYQKQLDDLNKEGNPSTKEDKSKLELIDGIKDALIAYEMAFESNMTDSSYWQQEIKEVLNKLLIQHS